MRHTPAVGDSLAAESHLAGSHLAEGNPVAVGIPVAEGSRLAAEVGTAISYVSVGASPPFSSLSLTLLTYPP